MQLFHKRDGLPDDKLGPVNIIPDFSVVELDGTGIPRAALVIHGKGEFGQDIDAGSGISGLFFDYKAIGYQIRNHIICFMLIYIIEAPCQCSKLLPQHEALSDIKEYI